MTGYESLSHSRWDCKYHVFLYQNVGESNYLVRSDDIWGQYSGSLQVIKSARLSRDI